MKILLVVATPMEANMIQQKYAFGIEEEWLSVELRDHKLYLLCTGIGMTSTAYMLGRFLALNQVDLAINLGIAGSFNKRLALGEVVEIIADSFAELGAEDGATWLDLKDLGFPQFQLAGQAFFNSFQNPKVSPYPIPKLTAITVNRTHGEETSIQKSQQYFPAQIETMEGAAFFHAMTRSKTPFWAFRSISNYVERRDRENWNIPLAIRNIQAFVMAKVEDLLENDS